MMLDRFQSFAWRRELPGLAMVSLATLFQLALLLPEIRIGVMPPNDGILHQRLIERLHHAVRDGEPFLDPWVSEIALGYPVWSSYQPLPHLIGAAFFELVSPWLAATAAFAWYHFLLMLILPASLYLGGRWLGLGPLGAGLISIVALLPSGAGIFERFGVGYGHAVWRGTGLLTQTFALLLLLPSVGLVRFHLDDGRGRLAAALALAATSLSHMVFGYMAFGAAAVIALVGPRPTTRQRLVRLFRLVMVALLLLAWFLVPLWLGRADINRSQWEPNYKWDSFGTTTILSHLGSGQLLDADRLPALSLFCLVGLVLCIRVSRQDLLARRAIALTVVFLLLFFGRSTWGPWVRLALIPDELHMHRFQAAFELFLLVAAVAGLERYQLAAGRRSRYIFAGLVVATVGLAGHERSSYLDESRTWGEETLAAVGDSHADLATALAEIDEILEVRGGRVAAGHTRDWADDFRVGDLPLYLLIARAGLDQVTYLLHAMSLTSDVLLDRREDEPTHDDLFAVRAVIAPTAQEMPAHLSHRLTAGPFAIYEAPGDGYFGLVEMVARASEGRPSRRDGVETSRQWLASGWPLARAVVALAPIDPSTQVLALPELTETSFETAPSTSAVAMPPCGRIERSSRQGARYSATVTVERQCELMLKATWHPHLVATVDNQQRPLQRVTPGFGVISLKQGQHRVHVDYQPGPLRFRLLLVGLALAGASACPDRWARRLRAWSGRSTGGDVRAGKSF